MLHNSIEGRYITSISTQQNVRLLWKYILLHGESINRWEKFFFGFCVKSLLFWCSKENLVVSFFTPLLKFHGTFSISLHKKWNFPLRIPSVNVTKPAVSCGFGQIYGKILNGKLPFLCSVKRNKKIYLRKQTATENTVLIKHIFW